MWHSYIASFASVWSNLWAIGFKILAIKSQTDHCYQTKDWSYVAGLFMNLFILLGKKKGLKICAQKIQKECNSWLGIFVQRELNLDVHNNRAFKIETIFNAKEHKSP